MAFNRNDVEALSASLGEPDWVLERRLEAWDWFEKMDLPGEKEEPWRYTNLARLKFKLDDFFPLAAIDAGSAPVGDAAVEHSPGRSGEGSQIGGSVSVALRDLELESAGVIFTDIHTAIQKYPELVRPHLFSQFDAGAHLFSALHGALFGGGAFLYVPRGRTVALPVEYACCLEGTGSAVFPHSLIVVEENAEVCFLERYRSSGKGPGLSDSAIEVVAGQASRVFVGSVQDYGKGVWHFQNQRFTTARDANFKSLVVTVGASFSRTESTTEIHGEGNSVDMMGIYVAGEGQHFDFRTLQDHAAPHSTSDLLYKGALRDNARTVYSGQIRVRPEGRETDAYQTNRNLILSDNAMANSKPELEIENNDVRCSHAASVGQMDQSEIFYLQSRGIDRVSAERLIVRGFLEEVLGKVGRKDVQEMVESLLEEKLA
ncbi:MAG TPA: Fe-S cluster assembly protein SufD [Actinomycetota bacterium]|nr:Fe-S cluster assembly protein SufD [Actinomycetota bacterium]